MSVVVFVSSVVTGYGPSGQESAGKMIAALQRFSLFMTYDGTTKKFTILHSSDISKQTIEKIFSEEHYSGWEPRVLDERDPLGNHEVTFHGIEEEDPFMDALHRFVPNFSFDAEPSKDDQARLILFHTIHGLANICDLLGAPTSSILGPEAAAFLHIPYPYGE